MLFYETVDPSTLELLKQLQGISLFADLRLVGGTALSLQYGHRKSIDLDLFGSLQADEFEMSVALSGFKDVIKLNQSVHIHIYRIQGIKVDIVAYPYPWIRDPVIIDGLLLSSVEDIAAMKLSAITGRGTKKDFYDIYLLLQYFSLEEMIQFYQQKYRDGSIFLVLKSLVFFEDAEMEAMPLLFNEVSWDTVKARVREVHSDYMSGLL
jgi:hypothetical protein